MAFALAEHPQQSPSLFLSPFHFMLKTKFIELSLVVEFN